MKRLRVYFEAWGIADEGRKCMVLIAPLKPEMCVRLHGLVARGRPHERTFKEAVQVLR